MQEERHPLTAVQQTAEPTRTGCHTGEDPLFPHLHRFPFETVHDSPKIWVSLNITE